MRISEAAARFGLPRHHIDYWRRTGLLTPGHGSLGFDDLRKVRLIADLRNHGFSLQKIRSLAGRIQGSAWHQSVFVHEETGRLLSREENMLVDPAQGQLYLRYDGRQKGSVLPIAPGETGKSEDLIRLEEEYMRALSSEDSKTVRGVLRKILKEHPKHVGALIEAGNFAFEESRYDEAVEYYERVLEVDPDCVEAIYNIANIYFRQKKYAAAIRFFHRSIDLDPDFPESYYNLGVVYYSLRYPRQASALFEMYLQLDPDSSWASQARQFMEDIRQLDPVEPDLFGPRES